MPGERPFCSWASASRTSASVKRSLSGTARARSAAAGWGSSAAGRCTPAGTWRCTGAARNASQAARLSRATGSCGGGRLDPLKTQRGCDLKPSRQPPKPLNRVSTARRSTARTAGSDCTPVIPAGPAVKCPAARGTSELMASPEPPPPPPLATPARPVQAEAHTSSVAALASGAFQPGVAEPLGSQDAELPQKVRDAIECGRESRLSNEVVLDLLHNHERYGFRAGQELPAKPPGARAAVCVVLQKPCRARTRSCRAH